MPSLAKQSIIYAIGEIIPKALGFIFLPIYTHFLSPGDYGILSYTNSVVMFLFVLSSLSLNSFVLRNFFEKKTEKEKKALIGNVYLTIGLINLFLLLLSYFCVPHLINLYKIQVPWSPYFKLAIINNFLEVFSIIPLAFYRVKQNAKYFVILNVSRIVLQYILTFVFIVIMNKGLIGHYYGRLFSLIPYFIIFWIVMLNNTTLKINFKQIKEGLKFSLPLVPSALSYLILGISDRIIMERSLNISEIGIYNLAYTLSFTLNLVVQSGYKSIEPEIFKRYGTESFIPFFKKTTRIFFFILFSAALLLSLFSQEVFKLMASDAFYNGYKLVPILLLGVIPTGFNAIYGSILMAQKRTKIIAIATIIGAIVSINLNIILIPYWGIWAPAITSAISFTIMSFIIYLSVNLNSKFLKTVLFALSIFSIISVTLFYIIKIDFGLTSILLKLFISLFVLISFSHLFRIDLKLILLRLINKLKS